MTDQSDSRPLTRPGFSGADAPALLLALPDPLLLIAADGTAHLNPAGPGLVNPLAIQALTVGLTVNVTATGVQILDADNTVMFEIP